MLAEPGRMRGAVDRRGRVATWVGRRGRDREPALDGSTPPAGTRVTAWASGGGWAGRRRALRPSRADPRRPPSRRRRRSRSRASPRSARLRSVGRSRGRASRSRGRRVGSADLQSSSRTCRREGDGRGRQPRTRAGLRELGADDVVVGLEAVGEPFDLILESAGGPSLAAALTRVSPDGTVVSFGNSSNEPTTFDARGFYRRGRPTVWGTS